MSAKEKLLVTGGAGFIGSNFVEFMLENYPDSEIITLDALTYAGLRVNLGDVEKKWPDRHTFIHDRIENFGMF